MLKELLIDEIARWAPTGSPVTQVNFTISPTTNLGLQTNLIHWVEERKPGVITRVIWVDNGNEKSYDWLERKFCKSTRKWQKEQWCRTVSRGCTWPAVTLHFLWVFLFACWWVDRDLHLVIVTSNFIYYQQRCRLPCAFGLALPFSTSENETMCQQLEEQLVRISHSLLLRWF